MIEDEAHGGIGLSVPAMQKVGEAAGTGSPTAAFDPGFKGGVRIGT